jgi:hypothetical protein
MRRCSSDLNIVILLDAIKETTVGGLAANNYGSITECRAGSVIIAEDCQAEMRIGGIVGANKNTYRLLILS